MKTQKRNQIADAVRLRGIKMMEIQRLTADFYGIPEVSLYQRARPEPLATIRQVAMVLCRQLVGATSVETARAFGRTDHCTVLHAEKAVADKCATDLSLKQQFAKLTNLCRRELDQII